MAVGRHLSASIHRTLFLGVFLLTQPLRHVVCGTFGRLTMFFHPQGQLVEQMTLPAVEFLEVMGE